MRSGADARGRPAAAALGAVLVLMLMHWPTWTMHSGPVGDAGTFHLPYQMLVGDFARHGELLTWNPWTNGGSPDGAEPQTGACSPIAVLCGFLGGGTPWSFVLHWLVTLALAALGMALLARHLGAPPWAQFGLALAWSSNGAFVGHACHTCFVHAFALLPFMLRALDRALLATGRERLRLAATAGGWWGLAALAGYPGVVMVDGLFLLAWALLRVLAPGDPPTAKPAHAALCLAVMTGVALVVLAPTYAAFFVEGKGFSGRTEPLDRATATGWHADDPKAANALDPAALWTVVHPGLARHAATDQPELFPISSRSSVGLDTGLGTWILAAVALFGAGRSRRRWALLAAGLLFLGLALGHTLPLRAWLYDLVPPTRFFRHPAIFRVGFLLAVALLAAKGARGLGLSAFARAALWVTLGSAALAALAHVCLAVPPSTGDVVWLSLLHALGLAVAAAARRGHEPLAHVLLAVLLALGATAALDLGAPLVHAPPDHLQRLAAAHRADLDLGAPGFDRHLLAPTAPPDKAEALRRGDLARVAEDLASPVGRLYLADNLPPKVPVLFGYAALNNGNHYALPFSPTALHMAIGAERVWFAADALHRPMAFDEFRAWTDEVRDHGSLPLVVHDGDVAPPDLRAAIDAARLRPLAHTVVRYSPTELVLELPPQEAAGWLFVTERWANGWRAEVDGRAAAVVPALFLWRAVELPAGVRTVRFAYRPFGAPWLLLLSLLTQLLLVVAAVAAGRHTAAAPPTR